MRPAQWIENLWYIARTYIELKKYDKAVEYLKQAVSIEPEDDSEKEALESSQVLLKKYSKQSETYSLSKISNLNNLYAVIYLYFVDYHLKIYTLPII